MPQKDPKHNLNALLIGTGEFSFSSGATSVTDTLLKGFLDFGNIQAFTPAVEIKVEDHIGSYRGVRRKDKSVSVENKIEYRLKCDEWNINNLAILFGASQGTATTQAALSAVACDALAFTAPAPSGTQKWYDLKVAGVRVRNLTSVTVATLTEATDFEVDLLLGRIRFLTSQVASRAPAVTGAVITAGTANSFLPMTPFGSITVTGYGRLVIYDQNTSNKVVLDHQDFSCEIKAETAGEMNGQNYSDMSLIVSVTTDVGVVNVRNDNNN